MDFASWPEAEKRGICAAIAVLVVGVCLAIIIIYVMGGDSATFIALLIIAVIVYGVASEKIQEFSAPGGWVAKFQKAASEKVNASGLIDCMQGLQIVRKRGLQALRDAGQHLEKGKPVALTLQLGRSNYAANELLEYIAMLRTVDHEPSIIFLNANGKVVAWTDATTLSGLLSDQRQSTQIIHAVSNSEQRFFQSSPDFLQETIKKDISNAEALQKMRETSARAMVVVDGEGSPIGVVKRDDIMARLLVELAGSLPAKPQT